MLNRTHFTILMTLWSVLLLGGCADEKAAFEGATGSIPIGDERPQDEPVSLGKLHFSRGDYGLAEQEFRSAVESNPQSAEAWLGLAASNDKLRRFDLADRAYRHSLSLLGRSPEVLNNLAYHYMLMGDLARAKTLLDEAEVKDPGNPTIEGNRHLLETWRTGEQPG